MSLWYTVRMGTQHELRATVAILMRTGGDNQTTLGTALNLTQGQISRKQAGKSDWTLADCDRIAAHYGITVPQLLSGRTAALAAALHSIGSPVDNKDK